MNEIIAFSSFTRIGLISPETGEELYPDLRRLVAAAHAPGGDADRQQGWQWGFALTDGMGMLVTSYEETAIDRIVTGAVRTRIWRLDLDTGRLDPVLEGRRPADFLTVGALLPDGSGAVVGAIVDGEQRLFRTVGDIASSSLRYEPLTAAGDGFHYGIDVSPDGHFVVSHVTGGKFAGKPGKPGRPDIPAYSIAHIDLSTGKRTILYGHDEHLYFAPTWSPDGSRLAFLDCRHRIDPAHFWSDLCVTPSRPPGAAATARSGSSYADTHRFDAAPNITSGQSHWFGTSHGPEKHRGGGSNMTSWTPDGRYVTWTRKAPDSHPDCRYDATRPDHQELVYQPDLARGGTQLCLIAASERVDPTEREVVEVTPAEEGRWDFRAAIRRDGSRIAFSRYRVGKPVELWSCGLRGEKPTRLTAGYEGHGCDHPRWVPAKLLASVSRAV